MTPTPPTKRCTTCHQTKPLESFYRYHRNNDGHLGRCKACFLAARAKHQAQHHAGHRWLWMKQGSSRVGRRGSRSTREAT